MMLQSGKARRFRGRAEGLVISLLLVSSLVSVAAAAPPRQGASPQWLDGMDLGQVSPEVLAPFSDVLADQARPAQTTGSPITVTSCGDSPTSSGITLRAAVNAAVSGDTIDLSQLSCNIITLGSQITIAQASLVIKGTPGTSLLNGPEPIIGAQHASRIFKHTGTGTLTLRNVALQEGDIDATDVGTSTVYGGCVYSDGAVTLDGANVLDCSATSASYTAAGGGVYAKGNITLIGSTWVAGNEVTGHYYAWGGGLYTLKSIVLSGSEALISGNSATVTSGGFARGGGIYASVGMVGGHLTVQQNTVQEASGASAQAVEGGGAYIGTALAGNLTITQNHALGPAGTGGGLFLHDVGEITASSISGNDAARHGGGVYAEKDTTIKTSTVGDNTAEYRGGGIYAEDALTLNASTVADNTAAIGGGVLADGEVTLEDSNITGNDASGTAGGMGAYDVVTIKRSTIADNTALQVAGAVLGSATSQPVTIEQSTISGNHSSDSRRGAGLSLNHETVIRNSTITRNIEQNSTNTTGYGAGISLATGVQLRLSSTIVSGNHLWWNSPSSMAEADDIGKMTGATNVHDILGNHDLVLVSTVPTPADTLVAYEKLNPLADNGGTTKTHMPMANSPVIDNGSNNGFSCDQRGDGFERVVGFAADIGAVEVQDGENSDRIFANGFDSVTIHCDPL